MAIMGPSLLVGIGNFKRYHMLRKTMLVKLTKAHLENRGWVVGLKIEGTKENLLSKVLNNSTWRACLTLVMCGYCS